ncbi:MAG: DUF1194 domain-containing protein [Pseudomonadota bacterium]
MLCLALAAIVAAAPAQAACKLALALGLDVSSSVDADEYRLQLEGLAAALTSPQIVDAILRPEGAHIVAAAYEWSGYKHQALLIDWTVLDSPAAVASFANRLSARERTQANLATALGKGVEFGARLLQRAPNCARYTIDISGDGLNNDGVGPQYFVREGLLDGTTVNGLVIRGAVPDPVSYYRKHVQHGPDAFVIVADGFSDYRQAMEEKLLREIDAQLVIGRR